MPKKEEQPKPEETQPNTSDLAAMLATVFAIYRLRDHRGEKDE